MDIHSINVIRYDLTMHLMQYLSTNTLSPHLQKSTYKGKQLYRYSKPTNCVIHVINCTKGRYTKNITALKTNQEQFLDFKS